MRTADSTTPVRGSKTAQPSCHALPPTQQQVKELGHPRVQGPDRAVRVAIGRTASPPCSTPRSPLPDLGSHPHQGGVRGRTAPSPPAGRRSCLPLRGGKKKAASPPAGRRSCLPLRRGGGVSPEGGVGWEGKGRQLLALGGSRVFGPRRPASF